MQSRIPEADAHLSQATAVIFAPHQDDETLGCASAIMHKRSNGVSVDVVYLTDGSSSHRHLMDPKQLAALREEEAISACQVLDVSTDRITFLRLPDGQVKESADRAVPQISQLLCDRQPEEIYIPYALDPQPDHQATNQLLRTVVRASDMPAIIMEYPVWAWYQWPWVQPSSYRLNRPNRQVIANTLRMGAGLRLCRDMNLRLETTTFRERKLRALAQHRSQMTKVGGNEDWQTLHHVANGDWLKWILRNDELFYRSQKGNKTT